LEGAKIDPEDGSSMVYPKRQQNSPKLPTPEKINVTSTMNLGYSLRLTGIGFSSKNSFQMVSSIRRRHNGPKCSLLFFQGSE
jgi:hypothetical protein